MQRLVVNEVNAVLDRWAGDENIKTYALSYEVDDFNHIEVWSTHTGCFHSALSIIAMAEALDFNWYFKTRTNQDNIATPCLVIFSV